MSRCPPLPYSDSVYSLLRSCVRARSASIARVSPSLRAARKAFCVHEFLGVDRVGGGVAMNAECPLCGALYGDKKMNAMNLDAPEYRGYCRRCRQKLKSGASS